MKPPAKKPRRRFRQYSLRTLGLLLCVCAALLWAWNHYVAPYRAQREAIERLKELGATIETEPGGPAWLRGLLGEEQFTTVVMVNLEHDKQLKDEDLAPLASLVDLRRLYLAGTPITDDGLKWLRHLKKLERLSLWGTKVTDAGLVHLVGLENLVVLDLHTNPVTNEGLAQLSVLPKLTDLRLFPRFTEVTLSLASLQSPYSPGQLSYEVPAAPIRDEAQEILRRAVIAATADQPQQQRANLDALDRLAGLDWPSLRELRYVVIRDAGKPSDDRDVGGWQLGETAPVRRLLWNLQVRSGFVSPNGAFWLEPNLHLTDGDFRAELRRFVTDVRQGKLPAWEEQYVGVGPEVFLLGLAYAAAEHGWQAESDELVAALLDRVDGGLPSLVDALVRTRLEMALHALRLRLKATQGDGRPYWQKFIAQCQQLRRACPQSRFDAQLRSLIEPLERDLAAPPPQGAVAAAIYRLRDTGRIWDDERRFLIAGGKAAIPQLVAALDDRTPTPGIWGFKDGAIDLLGNPISFANPTVDIRVPVDPRIPNGFWLARVLRRQDLALDALRHVSCCPFPTDGTLSQLPADERESFVAQVRTWWARSAGRPQAEWLRVFLDVFRDELAGAEPRARNEVWRNLGHLEGPEAILALAEKDSGRDKAVANLMHEFDIAHLVRTAFESLRAGRLNPHEVAPVLRYGDRAAYLQLAHLAEDPDSGVLAGLWIQQLPRAAKHGRNWSVPFLAAALTRTERSVGDWPGGPHSLADVAALELGRLASDGFGVGAPPSLLDAAVRDGVFRKLPGGDLAIIRKTDDLPTRRTAIRRARAWWLETGRELLADVIADDRGSAGLWNDLAWAPERRAAVAAALQSDDVATRHAALDGLRSAESYEIRRALVTALERETDRGERLQIVKRLRSNPRAWYLPALTRRLADRRELTSTRVEAAAAIDTLASPPSRGPLTLETWEAARAAARRVLADVREPLALRRRAFGILKSLYNPDDARLLRTINRRLPFVDGERETGAGKNGGTEPAELGNQ